MSIPAVARRAARTPTTFLAVVAAFLATVAVASTSGHFFHPRTRAAATNPVATQTAAPETQCGRPCVAAYQAIAEALPHDRNNHLAHAILGAPGFDYLQLARALHVPTIARIRADWRRYCESRYPGNSRALAICVRMIDSSKPTPVPAAPGWASS
jgi:hypothetical protein